MLVNIIENRDPMIGTDVRFQDDPGSVRVAEKVYDRRTITYANSFEGGWTYHTIKAIEWLTGKWRILRMVHEFERRNLDDRGQTFWRTALDIMGIDLLTPAEQIDNIPKQGPVIVVGNHPHGLVDGMIFADLIDRVRRDYRILTRSVLTRLDETASSFMISVPFQHDPDAQPIFNILCKKVMIFNTLKNVVALQT